MLRRSLQMQLDPGPDGIPVGDPPGPAKLDGHEGFFLDVVLQETDAGGRAIGQPQIKIAIEVPINGGQSAAVVGEIKPGDRRSSGESGGIAAEIQEGAISLAPAERTVFVEQPIQSAPSLFVSQGCWFRKICDW